MKKNIEYKGANVSERIKYSYDEEELRMDATCRNFRQVQIKGGREVFRDLLYYFDRAVKRFNKRS